MEKFEYYNFFIPLKATDFKNGDCYMDFLIDFDRLQQPQEKAELIFQSPLTKLYTLSPSLPEFLQVLCQQKQLQISEKRPDPTRMIKFYTVHIQNENFKFVQFPTVEIQIVTKPLSQQIRTNVFAVDKKVDLINIVSEQSEYFKGYEKDVERKMMETYAIKDQATWMNYSQDISTVAIELKLRVSLGEDSELILNFLSDYCRRYLIYYYKSLTLTYKCWANLSERDIIQKNAEVTRQMQIKSFRFNPCPTFQSLNDIIGKTNFTELKQKYLTKYRPIMERRSSQNTPQQIIISRNSVIRKKAGLLYKRGDGPIDYNWNQRYIVLDGDTLVYFKSQYDRVPRGFVNMRESTISTIHPTEDREHAFYIELIDSQRRFYFSGETPSETESWREELYKTTLPLNDFVPQQQPQSSNKNIPHNNYLVTEQLPSSLKNIENLISGLANLHDDVNWTFQKFRNGVKIFQKVQNQKRRFPGLKQNTLYSGTLFLLLGFFIDMIGLSNYRIMFITLGSALIGGSFAIKQKTRSSEELYARTISDVDPSRAFETLKSFKNKGIFDPNFTKVTKTSGKLESTEYNKIAIGHFQIDPILMPETTTQRKQIPVSITRYRFVLKEETYYIIDITTGQGLQMVEIYEIRRIQKVSGKAIINFYVSFNSDLNILHLEKYLRIKAENLSLVTQTLDEQRFQNIQQTIVNELSQSQISNQSIKILEKSQISNTNFIEQQINIIQDLKRGISVTPSKPLTDRKFGYRIYQDGGMECFNREEIRSQEGLVIELMKQAGKQLMEGKSVVGISLPVRIFEARSTIERICDWWGFYPVYLRMACRTSDQVERMKLIITMVIAGFYNGTKQKKPFNPILGETFQATWHDGTEIFIEHTSHHPPISHFLIHDAQKQFKIHGYYEYQAALRYNAVVGRQKGPNIIEFADGQRVIFEMPQVRISGMLMGARIAEYCDTFKFTDTANNMHCEIKFSEGAGLLLGRNEKPTDFFEGQLYRNGMKISDLSGSWLRNILWDGVVYWDLEKIDPVPLNKTMQPLPSDCRFRTDLVELSKGDMEKAQEQQKKKLQFQREKSRLEVIQRKDRRLRNEARGGKH